MIASALSKIERHWLPYPYRTMTWLLVICNILFTFSTVVEGRKNDYALDDCVTIVGILTALVVGFMVDVRPFKERK
jgi:hypothetical protein